MKISKYFLFLFFVLIIPVSAQAALGLPENIKQVKTAGNPAVYYLDHAKGIKKAYINGQAFLSYGNKWDDIKTISQVELGKWAEVQVVKAKSNSAVYYIKEGKKTSIKSAKDFVNLGFKWSEIVPLNETDLSQYAETTYEKIGLALYKLADYELVKAKLGSAVYYIKNKMKIPIKSAKDFIKLGFKWDDINIVEEEDLNDLTSGDYEDAGLDVDLNQTQSKLVVSLDSSSPSGANGLPLDTTNNLVAIFKLKSEVGWAEINSLNFSFKGIFSDEALANVYLSYDDQVDLGITPAINGKNISFNFRDNPLIISPGMSKKIYLWIDLNSCPTCTSHNLQATITQASDINFGGTITGSFPVAGASFNLVNALGVLGQVKIEKLSVGENNLEAIIGEAEQILGKFEVSEISGNEDIIINKLMIENQGTAQISYLSDFKLKNEDGNIISQVDVMTTNREIIFALDDYEIKKNFEEIFTVSASLNNGDGRIINLKLIRASIVGANINFGLKIDYSDLVENINIVRKDIGVVAKKLEASKQVFAAETGTIIGVFEIRNADQVIYLDSFDLSLVKNSGAPNLGEVVYLVNYDTGEILGQTSGQALTNGQINVNIPDNIIKPKEDFTLALITEMPKIIQDGYTYQLILNNVNYRTDNNLRLKDNVNIRGEALRVLLSKISIYPNPDLLDKTYTKGEQKIKVASFYLESSAGDDIKITGLSINKGSKGSSLTYANGFSNLKVYVGSKRLVTIDRPDKTAYAFDDFSYKLKAGRRIEVKIYVDTAKDLKITEADIKITALTAIGYSSGVDTEVVGLNASSNKVSFVEAKAKVEAIDSGAVSKETEDNIAGSFKITNTGGEEIKLNYLTLTASGNGFSYSAGYKSLALYRIDDKDKVRRVGSSISKPVAGANRLRMSSFRLEPGSELTVYVYVDTNELITSEDFKIYVSKLEASGYNSKVEVEVAGTPTAELDVVVSEE